MKEAWFKLQKLKSIRQITVPESVPFQLEEFSFQSLQNVCQKYMD